LLETAKKKKKNVQISFYFLISFLRKNREKFIITQNHCISDCMILQK
jgi:hypothetical protein